jgi:acylphosphatase
MANTNPIEVVRVHIWVTGRVQNVGFRAFVQQSGALLDLTGWVRNVGDAQVEAVAEGSRPAVEKFIAALRTGPRAARVDESRLEWENPTGEFPDFGVKYSVY